MPKLFIVQEMTCRFNANNTAVKVRSFSDVSSGSEDALKAALANNGPVSIAIDASHYTFQVSIPVQYVMYILYIS